MTLRRVLRRRDLRARDGLGATRRNELIASGEYPKPFKLTGPRGRALGWWEDEVAEWQAKRNAERDQEARPHSDLAASRQRSAHYRTHAKRTS
jgi:predicted DNA-binding transcriptional regulator AlpA